MAGTPSAFMQEIDEARAELASVDGLRKAIEQLARTTPVENFIFGRQ